MPSSSGMGKANDGGACLRLAHAQDENEIPARPRRALRRGAREYRRLRAFPIWGIYIQTKSSATFNGAYAKVRASLATALLRGKSIHALYESLWFVPCLLVVCLLLKRFFSSLARLAGSSATHTLRKNICWFFSWLVIGEGPELLDVGGQSSIAPLRRVTCRRSKSQSL